MAKTTIITDRLNSFFTNNKIEIKTGKPTSGSYKKGDIIVNIGTNNTTEPMWICVEDGSPGVWEVVGAGGTGSTVIESGSITKDKLADDIKEAIENVSNIDTSPFALKTDLNNTNAKVSANENNIGTLANLNTSVKDNLVNALNELNNKIGDVATLLIELYDDAINNL